MHYQLMHRRMRVAGSLLAALVGGLLVFWACLVTVTRTYLFHDDLKIHKC